MQVTWIELVKNHSWGRKGSRIEVSEDVASRLIENGFAKASSDPRKSVTETTKSKRGTRVVTSNKSLSAAE